MTDTYKITFRGDIASGHNFGDVRQRIAAMFKLEESAVAQLFSGRPVTLKKGLNADDAKKWADALHKAGLIVEIKSEAGDGPPVMPESPPEPEPDTPAVAPLKDDEGLWVEPPGADVLKPEERQSLEPVEVSVDHLSLDKPGADVLRPEERKPYKELVLDLSHLSLKDL